MKFQMKLWMFHLKFVMGILFIVLLKNEFDSLQVKLNFEKPCHRNQIEEHFEDYHVFYDPVTDYLEKKIGWDSWLCFCYKYQVHYHIFYHYFFQF